MTAADWLAFAMLVVVWVALLQWLGAALSIGRNPCREADAPPPMDGANGD